MSLFAEAYPWCIEAAALVLYLSIVGITQLSLGTRQTRDTDHSAVRYPSYVSIITSYLKTRLYTYVSLIERRYPSCRESRAERYSGVRIRYRYKFPYTFLVSLS